MSATKPDIFTDADFYPAFIEDLKTANSLVIILSPFLSVRRISNLAEVLNSCLARRVRVCVFTQEINERQPDEQSLSRRDLLEQAERKLLKMSVHVSFRKKVHEKMAIIDESILWDGSLNILSHFDSAERMTRRVDRELVSQAMIKHQLGSCNTCCARANISSIFPQLDHIPEARKLLGATIAEKRKSLQMSQRELALKSGVDQGVISGIESGKRNVQLNSLLELATVLGLTINGLPWYCTPSIYEQTAKLQTR